MSELSQPQQWTEVIAPRRSLLDINLKEIWRYRDLIALFVRRDFVAIYKQTILGPIWLFLQPLFTTAIYLFVFNRIAGISTDAVPATLFYLSGVVLWTYFADCFTKTSNTFLSNAGIFGKVYFPRLVTPISIVFSNLIKFAIQGSLFVAIYVYMGLSGSASFHFSPYLLLVPYLVMLMAAIGLGLGTIFSSLTTKYRDLAFLLQFGVQLLMYCTPVIYPLSYTQGMIRRLIQVNPLTPVIETFRFALFGSGHFDATGLVYSSGFALVVLFLGFIIFNKVEKNFMDTV